MQRTQALALGILATLALAGAPAISSASVITTAHALHTGVQPRMHAHHAHSRHARHGRHGRTELRAAATPRALSHTSPAPVVPRRRPAHAHAVLPHAGMKLHRNSPRGGAPYALGQASLSLALWTSADSMPVTRNESISDPSSGILKGRSPPRGIPLNAMYADGLARPLYSASRSRAFADPFRDCRNTPALLSFPTFDPRLVEACPRRGASGPGSSALPTRPDRGFVARAGDAHGIPARSLLDATVLTVRALWRGDRSFPITPDRASEGRAAGSLLPSRRWFT